MRSSSWVCTARTRPNDASAIAAATTTVAAMVIRTRTERRRASGWASGIGDHPVAHAPHGLQRPAAERGVDLAPQVAHVHLDHIGVTVEVAPPHRLQQVDLRPHGAGPA